MAEELEDLEKDENINRTEERIKDLSSKARDAYSAKDAAEAKAQAEVDARATAEKERDFYKDFSGLTNKYQSASEYQEQILEKVKAGYTVEDATVSVLNAEGKLSTQSPIVAPPSAAGGSASTIIPNGEKTVQDMTQAERREALLAANESGELAETIKNWGR